MLSLARQLLGCIQNPPPTSSAQEISAAKMAPRAHRHRVISWDALWQRNLIALLLRSWCKQFFWVSQAFGWWILAGRFFGESAFLFFFFFPAFWSFCLRLVIANNHENGMVSPNMRMMAVIIFVWSNT